MSTFAYTRIVNMSIIGKVTQLLHVCSPSLVAAGLGSATVIWQMKTGLAELKADIDEVKKELKADINGVKVDIDGVKKELKKVHEDVQGLRAKVQDFKSMILGNGHHVMNALDGNKKPMRDWLHKLKHCKQSESGSKDCDSIAKA
ncbi:hypothetical protein RUND412_004986 [Rhizina undulata]